MQIAMKFNFIFSSGEMNKQFSTWPANLFILSVEN